MRDRQRLIARIGQMYRASADRESTGTTRSPSSDADRVRALETRLAHLEQLVQGLQDSVHRESSRQAKRIADLEAAIQPGTLGKALSADARARGLS
jgi:hypothetical protein